MISGRDRPNAPEPRRTCTEEPKLSLFSHDALRQLIATNGYWLITAVIGFESMGLPLPGETILIMSAVYAGTTGNLDIALVIAAASFGAVLGGQVGFALGRAIGLRVLLRYGRFIWVNEAKIKLGQYLFLRHGGKVVFLGRFFPVLRSIASFLAGVNRMSPRRFAMFNVAGGLAWAGGYGFAAFLLAGQIHHLAGKTGMALGAGTVILLLAVFLFVRRHHAELERKAERAFPGPIRLDPPPAR